MPALLKCKDFVGGTTLVESPPAILTLHDVIYVPLHHPGSQPGIFDHGQKLVLQSWYFRGARSLATGRDLSTPYTPSMVETAPDDCYIYGGWLHDHFGHFLLSSLSRYWSTLPADNPSLKILFHSDRDMEWWFARPWFAAMMGGLGLAKERFVRFEGPVRLRRLLLPAPAFEEESFVHRGFATSCNALGRTLAGGLGALRDNTPVFLSKRHLRSGVQKLDNEDAIADALEHHGVEIICPETLSLQEQVALWYARPFIVSFVSSAVHTSIFAPACSPVVVSYGPGVMSNYALVDRANRNTALYLHPPDGTMETLGPRDGFNMVHRARDPVAIADQLLRALDFRQRAAASRAGEALNRRRGYWTYPPAGFRLPDPEDRLLNVAIDKPSRQSSHHPWVKQASPDATSGTLTGEYQFHTENEQDPWWEVDLARTMRIAAIRLFNRLDNSQERCGRFRIDLRGEATDWITLHHQTEALLFGGLDGTPFVWIAPQPVEGRILRITLLGRDYLHLDQVEVIGHPVQAAPPTAAPPPPAAPEQRPAPSLFARLLGRVPAG